MMSSVIPARLVFQCGHAALVSLPRIKGESSPQRADRVAREKSAAQIRACDFCAQRLEVVVQQTAPAPLPAPVMAPAPPATPVLTPAPTPAVPRIEPVRAVAPAVVNGSQPVKVTAPAEVVVATPPRRSPRREPVANKRVTPVPVPVPQPVSVSQSKIGQPGRTRTRVTRSARNGRVANGTRFTVHFQVETVLRAADIRDALHQAQSLGAVEVLAVSLG